MLTACRRVRSFFIAYDHYWLALTVLLVWCFVFQEYFVFDKIFLFDKYAVDTISQFYAIEYFRVNSLLSQHIPYWSFQFGFGENVYNLISGLNPFDIIYIFFGRNNLAKATSFIIFIKFLTAALFFHAFLKKIKIASALSYFGSICYTFSGYMILNSHWYHYPNYAVYSAIFLYLFEKWYQDKIWIPIVILIGLFSIKGELQIFQVGFFGFFYIFYRCANNTGININLFKTCIKIFCLYVLGILVWSYFFIPDIYKFIVSARVKNAISDVSDISVLEKIFHFTGAQELILIISRFFSPDMNYSWLYYNGIRNYFQDSSMYIGILPFGLFFIPFFLKQKKYKFLWIFPTITLLFLIFPYMRSVLNAFVSGSFKYLSFYLGFYALFSAIIVTQIFFNKKSSDQVIGYIKNLFLISCLVYIVLFLFLYKFRGNFGINFHKDTIILSALFLALACTILYSYKKRNRSLVVFSICLILLFEIIISSRTVTSQIPAKFSPFFEKRGEYYFNKNTMNALDDIKNSDNSFFRIEKNYNDGSLNDAIVQDYFGTKAYLGFPGTGMVEFCNNFLLVQSAGSYRRGLEGKRNLQNLLTVKYLLCKNTDNCDNLESFSFLNTYGDINVYRNDQVDTLGKMFYYQITPARFQQLSPEERSILTEDAIVSAEILPGIPEKTDILSPSPSQSAEKDIFQLNDWNDEFFSGNINVRRTGVLFFSIPYDSGWRAFVNGKPMRLLQLNFAFSGVELTTPGEYHIELRYRPPFMVLGLVMSCAGILFTFFLWRRYPRISPY